MDILSDRSGPAPESDLQQPRVLHLLSGTSGGHTPRQVSAVASAVREAGGETVVAGGDARAEQVFHRAGIDHRPYTPERSGMFLSASTQALLDTVHQRDLDIVHVHGAEMGLAAKSFADAAGLPLVMTCPTLPVMSGFLGRRASRKHVAGRPVIVHHNYAAEVLRRDFGVSENSVKVIPPGLDIREFEESLVSTERTIALAMAWGVVDDAREIVLVPGATTDPGWLNWILTVAMDAEAPDAVWVLVGGGAETEDKITEILGKSNAGNRLRWVPTCNDWTAAYKLASMVLNLPADRNGAYTWALEAQAMGRPVAVNDIGGGAEMLEPGKTGWLVRDRDPGSLLYAVSASIGRETVLRNAMAMAARNFIATRFSVTAMQKATAEVYAKVLRRA